MSRLQGRKWLAPALVFVAAFALFAINLERPPHPDELHHVLAAQQLFETGRPVIAEGEYTRGILYTWLVAVSYELFGDSLSSARLPAVLAVALLATILFIWIRREAGIAAAWVTALLFVTSPFVVEIAQFSRFYALQMLFFTLGAICVFYGAAAGLPLARRFCLFGLAAGLMALSVWVQDTTFIGLVAIGAWFAALVGMHAFRGATASQAAWRSFALLVALALIAVLALTVLSDEIAWAWRRYRTASLFAAESTDDFWYYHLRYVLFYPTLWPLTAALVLCAALRNSRLAWFAATVFGVSFLLTSFAAQKATRYFSYVQPLVAVVWGVGLAHVAPAIWHSTEGARRRLGESIAMPADAQGRAGIMLFAAAIACAVVMNPFWVRSAAIIGDVALPGETPTTNWRAARVALGPWVADADIMISTEELGALYFLGRSDVRYSPSKMDELPEEQRMEFGIDPRTGRPIITKPESLELLIECFDKGFVTGPAEHWGSPILINSAAQEVLRRYAEPIPVPPASHLYAWGWQHPPVQARRPACTSLDRFSRPGSLR